MAPSTSLTKQRTYTAAARSIELLEAGDRWVASGWPGDVEWRKANAREHRSEPTQLFAKLIGGEIDLAEDFAQQRWGEIAPSMVGNGCRAPVRMPIEDATSLLADRGETQVEEGTLKSPKAHNREVTHSADPPTSIC